MLEIATRWIQGRGESGEIELMETLARNLAITSKCGLGQAAGTAFLTSLKLFKDEYHAHVEEGKCPAGTCAMCGGVTDNG